MAKVKPKYLKKIEEIQKTKGVKFESIEEFDEHFSEAKNADTR